MEGFRLSPHQKSLYLQHQDALNLVQVEIKILGNLNPEILRKAVQIIMSRHEILRTGFSRPPGIKIPLQVVFSDQTVTWREIDLSQSSEQKTAIHTLLEEEKAREFNLETGNVFHACLVKLSEQSYSLLVTLSAFCSDSVSLGNLTQEISQTYQACLTNTPLSDAEEITQYLQFSEWQNELLEDEESLAGQQYWQQQNLFSSESLQLPLETQPNQKVSKNLAFLNWDVQSDFAQKLEYLSQTYQASLSDFLFTAWSIFLHRLTQKTEIIVKIISKGRQYEELEAALGLYAKALPIKINLETNSQFLEILEQIQSKLSEASQWQDYFILENLTTEKSELAGFEFEFQEWPIFQSNELTFRVNQAFVNFDAFKLKLDCHYSQQLTKFVFHYHPAYFNPTIIQEIAEQFQAFLESLLHSPNIEISRLKLLSEKASQSLLIDFNQTQAAFPQELCIHQLFEAQVEQNPEKIALIFEEETLTYRQLNDRANQLAHSLQSLGVQPDSIVGLCVERSLDLIIGILSILKAGGAYLPLDPKWPNQSISDRLQDAQVAVVVTQQPLVEKLPETQLNIVEIEGGFTNSFPLTTGTVNQPTPTNLAYVIYTSGSTGTPKGVMIEHRHLVHYIHAVTTHLNLSASTSFATVSTFAADLGNTTLFSALCTGGCLHIISSERAANADAFADYCRRHPIDCLKIVPSHLNALLSAAESQAILPRRHLILGGEPFSWQLVQKLQQYQPTCQIFNHYGPTETTVGALTYRVETPAHPHAATVPLGCPLPNTQVYILDQHQQPLPVGVAGELYIGGAGVARGYLHQPDLTTEKFISNFPHYPLPITHYPIYKTGDLARYLPDGNIEFLGRSDNQVKIRGFRVELGEIENALRQHPAVQEAVVIARDDVASQRQLVAYVVLGRWGDGELGSWGVGEIKESAFQSSLVPRHSSLVTSTDLREFLSHKLPEHLIPFAFVTLKAFPLTSNGKVNRQALPAPASIQTSFVAPRNPVEAAVAKIWAEVLELEKVGIHDNFFELGGDSIMSIQIAARLNRAGLPVTPKQLFENQTVAGLARVISPEIPETPAPALAASPLDAGIVETLQKALNLQPDDIEDIYELTPIQKGILFHSVYAPEEGLYFFQTRFRLRGNLNIDALHRAWQQVVDRHPILRTGFYWENIENPLQVVYRQVNIPLEQQDWREMKPAQQERHLQAFLDRDRKQGFDLSQNCLMRLTLIHLAENEYEFIWSRHFIIVDGWSVPVVMDEVVQRYETLAQGQEVALTPGVPFRNYLTWFQQQNPAQAETFWRQLLQGFRTPTPITHLLAGSVENPHEQYQDEQIILSEALTHALQNLAKQHQLTVSTLVQGTWALLLSRYSTQRDIVYGCTVAGRPPDLPEAESMVGMFVNTLPVRLKIDLQTPLLDWLTQLQALLVEMRQYEYSSLVEVQTWSEVPRGMALFESIVVFENLPVSRRLREGHYSIEVSDSANLYKINYPLTIVAIPGIPLTLGINYDFRRFEAGTIRAILSQFQTLLAGMAQNPDISLQTLLSSLENSRPLVDLLEKEAIFIWK
jgi:amino acid adenylation domain-containing protein